MKSPLQLTVCTDEMLCCILNQLTATTKTVLLRLEERLFTVTLCFTTTVNEEHHKTTFNIMYIIADNTHNYIPTLKSAQYFSSVVLDYNSGSIFPCEVLPSVV